MIYGRILAVKEEVAGSELAYPFALNLLPNPGFETNTSSWSGAAATFWTGASATGSLTRDTTVFHSGVASGKMLSDGLAALQGVSHSGALTGLGLTTYTFSAWVKATEGEKMRIAIRDTTNQINSVTGFTCTGDWDLVSVTITTGTLAPSLLLAITLTGAARVATFWVDDAWFGGVPSTGDNSTLFVESTLDFPEPKAGKTVPIMIEGIRYAYSALNDTANTLTLAAPATAAIADGSRIDVYPEIVTRRAICQIDDAEEQAETVEPIIPHSLWDKLKLGLREPEKREAVEIDDDGDDWVVANILSQPARITPKDIDATELSDVVALLGNVKAGSIEGTVIRGGRVEGATISTGGPNEARIVLADTPGENDRIKFFGAGGALAGNIRAADGRILVAGGLTLNSPPKWGEPGDTTMTDQTPVLTSGPATTPPTKPQTYLKVTKADGVTGRVPFYT